MFLDRPMLIGLVGRLHEMVWKIPNHSKGYRRRTPDVGAQVLEHDGCSPRHTCIVSARPVQGPTNSEAVLRPREDEG